MYKRGSRIAPERLSYHSSSVSAGGIACIWSGGADDPIDSEDEAERTRDEDAWILGRLLRGPLVLPDAPAEYKHTLNQDLSVSLPGSTIQVIVKLANIVLTPEKPEYPGGIWHVEGRQSSKRVLFIDVAICAGMATESIVSTFISII
jgi:hypothetical protein